MEFRRVTHMCETQVHEHIEHEEMTFLFEQLIAVETARDYFLFMD